MSYIFLSVPRSGSHYIQSYLHQVSGTLIDKSHVLEDCNNIDIIGIVRSPEDTVRSWLSMTKFYDEHTDISIESMLFEYIRLNSFIIDNAKIIINYDSFLKSPKAGIDKLCSITGVNNNHRQYEPMIQELAVKGHLISSKSYSGYDKIDLSNINFDECNRVYSTVIDLSII